MLVSGAAVLLGAILTYGIQHTPGAAPQQAAQALATTSAQPGVESGGPTAPTATTDSSPPPPTPTVSPSPSASATGTMRHRRALGVPHHGFGPGDDDAR